MADRIYEGAELGVFLHELGAHIGLDRILSPTQRLLLARRIKQWANANDGSVESMAAKAALARTKKAITRLRETPNFDEYGTALSERLGYFIEELVNAGVNPRVLPDASPLKAWFRQLVGYLKAGMEKLDLGYLSRVSGQDLIDMALGAAHVAIDQNLAVTGPAKQASLQSGPRLPLADIIETELEGRYESARAKVAWKGVTLDWLSDKYGKIVPPIKTLSLLYDKVEAVGKHWIDRAEHTLRRWKDLSKAESVLLSELMRRATRLEWDPDPDKNRMPMTAEQHALRAVWNRLDRMSQVRQRGRTNRASAIDIYREVRDHFAADLEEARKLLEAGVAKVENADRKAALASMLERLKRHRTTPYFPLRRMGEYYSIGMSQEFKDLYDRRFSADPATKLSPAEVARYKKLEQDPAHYFNRGHASRAEAKRYERAMAGKYAFVSHNTVRKELYSAAGRYLPEAAHMESLLEAAGIEATLRDTLLAQYENLLVNALPEGHMLKRVIERKGVAGEEENMRQVFAHVSQARAFALSRLMYAREISEQMAELDQLHRRPGEAGRMARDLYLEMRYRESLALGNPSGVIPAVRFITKGAYLSLLAGSLTYLLLNLSQTPVIAWPWVAAYTKSSARAALAALTKGAADTREIMSSHWYGEWAVDIDWDEAKRVLPPDEVAMLETLRDHGQLDFTMGYDLSAVAEGRDDVLDNLLRTIDAPVRMTEILNRGATGLAAMRLYKKSHPNASPAEVADFALDAVKQTQANYAPSNRPPVLQLGGGMRNFSQLFGQFWNYQLQMAGLMISNAQKAIRSADPDEQAMARRAIRGWTATLLAVGGLFGLPFASTLFGAASFIYSLVPAAVGGPEDDEVVDWERDFKNLIAAVLPEFLADGLTRGYVNVLTGGDVASRMSMGNLLNPWAYARFSPNGSTEDTLKEGLWALTGAGIQNATTILDGLMMALSGEDQLKAMEKWFPLKGVRDAMKGWNLYTDGFTDRDGNVIIPKDQFTGWEIAMQAGGLAPEKKQRYYARLNIEKTIEKTVEAARSDLLTRYSVSFINGDTATVAKLWNKIEAFNLRNPERMITWETLARSIDRRQKTAESRDHQGVVVDTKTAPYQSYSRYLQ